MVELCIPEELTWRLPSEKSFKRGVCVTLSATGEQMIFWLQRGSINLEVNRWKGYGEEMPVGTALLQFDPSPFITTVFDRSGTVNGSTMSYGTDHSSDILDHNLTKIGEINITFNMMCNGSTVISEYQVSDKGLFEFLKNVESEKKVEICHSCGKYGSNYEYQLLEDMSLAIVPNAIIYDNTPIIADDKYMMYKDTLEQILKSPNPVAKLGQHLEMLAADNEEDRETLLL